MITNFEEFTHELTDYELINVVPWVETELSFRVGKGNAVTNNQLTKMCPHKITTPRIRKIIHALRVSGKIPLLIANSKGYFRSENPNEVEDWIRSAFERASSINEVANAVRQQLGTLKEDVTQTKLKM